MRRRIVHTSTNGTRRSYSGSHCFSQIIFCGDCGELFRRIHWNNRGRKSIVWRCESRLTNTGVSCRTRIVNEEALIQIVLKAINSMVLDKDSYMETLQNNIAEVIRSSGAANSEELDRQLEALQKELIKKANNREAYDAIADEIFRLRELKQQSDADLQHREEQIRRITELCDF